MTYYVRHSTFYSVQLNFKWMDKLDFIGASYLKWRIPSFISGTWKWKEYKFVSIQNRKVGKRFILFFVYFNSNINRNHLFHKRVNPNQNDCISSLNCLCKLVQLHEEVDAYILIVFEYSRRFAICLISFDFIKVQDFILAVFSFT